MLIYCTVPSFELNSIIVKNIGLIDGQELNQVNFVADAKASINSLLNLLHLAQAYLYLQTWGLVAAEPVEEEGPPGSYSAP